MGDFCICGVQKWFPIADDGVLYAKQELLHDIVYTFGKKKPSAVFDAMILKHWFFEKGIDCNSLYRKLFEEELKLDDQQEV